jgi:hypothetical protein
MADFAPQVPPTQEPNYFKYSEPVGHIKGVEVSDKSTGIALSTVGDVLEGGIKLADQTVKKQIDEVTRSMAEGERTKFASSLEQVKGGVIPGPVQTPTGSRVLGFADEDATTPAPAAIDAGLAKVSAVQDALHSGKVNDTYYTQQLNSGVQRLRAQYPGYVDYIDSKVSEITGMNPANAYVKNLMEDINRAQSNKKTEFDKDLDMARAAIKQGIPGADVQFNRLQADPNYASTYRSWLNGQNSRMYSIELDNAARANRKGTKEEIASDDEAKFTNVSSQNVASNLSSVVTIPGIDTPQSMLKVISDAAANPDKYNDTQMRALASRLAAQKAVVLNQLTAMSAETKNGIPSYVQNIGTSKRDEILKSTAAVYDQMIDALIGGGPQGAGMAFFHANQYIARTADRKDNLSKGPLGQDFDNYSYINEHMGPNWGSMLTADFLRANVDSRIRVLLNQKGPEAVAQPEFDKTGKPTTFKQHLQEAQADKRITPEMMGGYAKSLGDLSYRMTAPDTPIQAKLNLFRYYFSPEGQGVLSGDILKTDYYDPQRKVQVPGKYSVWSRFSSDDMVKTVSELSRMDPTIGQQYKQWMENEAGSQLFYKEFQNLNRFTGHDDLHFRYNNGDKGGDPSIELLNKDGSKVVPRTIPGTYSTTATQKNLVGENPAYLDQINTVVQRINSALSGMSRVEKGFGGDVNAYLLNFLQHSQVDLGKNWTGLPKSLADAIAASRAPARRVEDSFRDLK